MEDNEEVKGNRRSITSLNHKKLMQSNLLSFISLRKFVSLQGTAATVPCNGRANFAKLKRKKAGQPSFSKSVVLPSSFFSGESPS